LPWNVPGCSNRELHLAGRIDVVGFQNHPEVMVRPPVTALADAAAARAAVQTFGHDHFKKDLSPDRNDLPDLAFNDRE
jgi:hypothetical protein